MPEKARDQAARARHRGGDPDRVGGVEGAPIPSRVVDPEAAFALYGRARVTRVLAALHRADPLADAAVAEAPSPRVLMRLVTRALEDGIDRVPEAGPALRALFAQLDTVPAWVDWARLERAGDLLFRAGPAGGITLGSRSLLYGYCSPAGNKPLVLTGGLTSSVSHRVSETGRFVAATCMPGGLRRDGAGFAITVRVRLMHAAVRALLWRSGRWDAAAWGEPINQHDMVATSLLFSLVFVQGIRAFGVRVTEREAEDFLHLWRYSSYLMGCEEALLPASEAEAELLGDIIDSTQGDPDEDSKALARALLESPRERFAGPVGELLAAFHVQLGYGFARFFLHRELPSRLGLPRTPLVAVVPACRLLLRASEPLRPRTPASDAKAVARGRVYWDRVIELGLAGEPARFALPEALRGIVRGAHAPG